MTIASQILYKMRLNKCKKLLHEANDELKIENAFKNIESELSSSNAHERQRIWEGLYEDYKYLPTNESLDNEHFYILMKLKRDKIINKLSKKGN